MVDKQIIMGTHTKILEVLTAALHQVLHREIGYAPAVKALENVLLRVSMINIDVMVLVDVSIAMVVVLKEITGIRAFVRHVMVQESAIIVEVLENAPLVEDQEDGKKMTCRDRTMLTKF